MLSCYDCSQTFVDDDTLTEHVIRAHGPVYMLPVERRGIKYELLAVFQNGGFMCPGCCDSEPGIHAMREHYAICPLVENMFSWDEDDDAQWDRIYRETCIQHGIDTTAPDFRVPPRTESDPIATPLESSRQSAVPESELEPAADLDVSPRPELGFRVPPLPELESPAPSLAPYITSSPVPSVPSVSSLAPAPTPPHTPAPTPPHAPARSPPHAHIGNGFLRYDPVARHIYCIRCCIIVTDLPRAHLYRPGHGLLSAADKAFVERHSKKEFPQAELLPSGTPPPFPYLRAPISGLQCKNCNQCFPKAKGFSSVRCINDRKIHKQPFEKVSIQTNGQKRSWFAVAVAVTDAVTRTDTPTTHPEIVCELMKPRLTAIDFMPALLMIYRDLGWHNRHGELPTLHAARSRLMAQDLFTNPKDLKDFKDALKALLWEQRQVLGRDELTRALLSEYDKKAFYSEVSEETFAIYFDTAFKLLSFIVHYCAEPLPDTLFKPLNPSIVAACNAFLQHGKTPKRAVTLLQEILGEDYDTHRGQVTIGVGLFLRFCSLNEDGTLKKASAMGQFAAHLQYMARPVAMAAADGSGTLIADYAKRMHGGNKWALCLVRLVQNAARRGQQEEILQPIIEKCPGGVKVNRILVPDDTLSRARTNGYQALLDMLPTLLPGGSVPLDLKLVSDNWSDLSDTGTATHEDVELGGSLVKLCDYLAKRIMADPVLREEWTETVLVPATQDKPAYYALRWKLEKIKWYLDHVEKALAILLMLIHIGGGMPARATEIPLLQVCNTTSSMRNLFHANGEYSIIPLYNKTDAKRINPLVITRTLDKDLSHLVAIFNMVVRPFAARLAELLRTSEPLAANQLHPDAVYDRFMFVHSQRPVTAAYVRETFTEQLHKYTGVRLGFLEYRHYAIYLGLEMRTSLHEKWRTTGKADYIGRATINYLIFGDEGDYNCDMLGDMLATNSGHRIGMHDGRYGGGRLAHRHPATSQRDYESARRASELWHRVILRITQEGDSVTAAPAGESLSEALLQQLAHITLLLQQHPRASPNTGAQYQFNVHPQYAQYCTPICDLASARQPTIPTYADQLMINRVLRELKGPTATFKSPGQAAAVGQILIDPCSMICVLPTGGGKTLVMDAYLHKNPDRLVVMIVPTKALLEDMARRARDANIAVQERITTLQNDTRLLIIIPDDIASPNWDEMQRDIINTRRLGLVVVDEAHTLVTDADYRPVMNFAAYACTTWKAHVVALTATLPPVTEQKLRELVFSRSSFCVQIFREPTTRHNLALKIEPAAGKVHEHVLALIARELPHLTGRDRAIIFCPTKEAAIRLAADSQGTVEVYHAEMTDEEQKCAWARWKSGAVRAIAATSCFGMGIDYAQVRLVIFAGCPYSVIDLAQQSGRAGRDGLLSRVTLVHSNSEERERLNWVGMNKDGAYKVGQLTAVHDIVRNSTRCRRQLLQVLIDGGTQPYWCADADPSKCDICSLRTAPPGTIQPPTDLERLPEVPIDMVHLPASIRTQIRSDALERQSEASVALLADLKHKSEQRRSALDDLWRLLPSFQGICPPCLVFDNVAVNHGPLPEIYQSAWAHRPCARCSGLHRAHVGNKTTYCFLRAPSIDRRNCAKCWAGTDGHGHQREKATPGTWAFCPMDFIPRFAICKHALSITPNVLSGEINREHVDKAWEHITQEDPATGLLQGTLIFLEWARQHGPILPERIRRIDHPCATPGITAATAERIRAAEAARIVASRKATAEQAAAAAERAGLIRRPVPAARPVAHSASASRPAPARPAFASRPAPVRPAAARTPSAAIARSFADSNHHSTADATSSATSRPPADANARATARADLSSTSNARSVARNAPSAQDRAPKRARMDHGPSSR